MTKYRYYCDICLEKYTYTAGQLRRHITSHGRENVPHITCTCVCGTRLTKNTIAQFTAHVTACQGTREPEPESVLAALAGIRAGDSDREETLETLAAACRDGYLTVEEFQGRLNQVWETRTRSGLAALTADLPPAPQPPRKMRITLPGEALAAAYLIIAVVLTAVQPAARWWPWLILAACAGFTAALSRRPR